jgi:hypothetical protein
VAPDEVYIIDRFPQMPSVRRLPNGEILDLTRPLTDRESEVWYYVGFATNGVPLITVAPGLGFYAPMDEIWDGVGPFRQAPA